MIRRTKLYYKISGHSIFLSLLLLSPGILHATQKSTVLLFIESEAGVEPFDTRFIVSDRYIRIDGGDDKDDFVLYDKIDNVIYNVTHDDHSILELKNKPGKLSPEIQERINGLELAVQEKKSTDLPKIAGKLPVTRSLLANNEVCTQVSSVDGLLLDVMDSLKKYQELLVSNNKNNLSNMPIEYITSCMLANDIEGATRYLEFGFPIYWKKQNGYSRFLSDFKEGQSIDPVLFALPEQYERYSPLR